MLLRLRVLLLLPGSEAGRELPSAVTGLRRDMGVLDVAFDIMTARDCVCVCVCVWT